MKRILLFVALALLLLSVPALSFAQEGTLNVRGLGNVATYNLNPHQ